VFIARRNAARAIESAVADFHRADKQETPAEVTVGLNRSERESGEDPLTEPDDNASA
jgi:hypothetical protein